MHVLQEISQLTHVLSILLGHVPRGHSFKQLFPLRKVRESQDKQLLAEVMHVLQALHAMHFPIKDKNEPSLHLVQSDEEPAEQVAHEESQFWHD